MAWRPKRSSFLRSVCALTTVLAISITVSGCSRQRDSVPELGTAQDYLAQRQNSFYAENYGPFCAPFDPYCFMTPWYPAPIYYYSRDDGDHDCDDGYCGGFKRGGRNRPTIAGSSSSFVATPHRFEEPSSGSAAFTRGFGRGAVGGHGHR